MRATYIGPIAHLRGEVAIVERQHPYARRFLPRWMAGRSDLLFAQFNNRSISKKMPTPGRPRSLRRLLGFRWQAFKASDWRIDPDWLAAEANGLSYSNWVRAGQPASPALAAN